MSTSTESWNDIVDAENALQKKEKKIKPPQGCFGECCGVVGCPHDHYGTPSPAELVQKIHELYEKLGRPEKYKKYVDEPTNWSFRMLGSALKSAKKGPQTPPKQSSSPPPSKTPQVVASTPKFGICNIGDVYCTNMGPGPCGVHPAVPESKRVEACVWQFRQMLLSKGYTESDIADMFKVSEKKKKPEKRKPKA